MPARLDLRLLLSFKISVFAAYRGFDDSQVRANAMEQKSPVWVPAHETLRQLKPLHNSEFLTKKFICKRAHAGLLRAKAQQYIVGNNVQKDQAIPHSFWWAEGEAALTQDWKSGDFETYINQQVRLRAFAVSFSWDDFKPWIPDSEAPIESLSAPAEEGSQAKGGRPPADWWEDLLIDLSFRYFKGDLKPKSQADIVRAMQEWITAHGCDAAESTVKLRAKKLLTAIQKDLAGN
jgi:hypothetical protein